MTKEYIENALNDAATLMHRYAGTDRAEMWRQAYRRIATLYAVKFPPTQTA